MPISTGKAPKTLPQSAKKLWADTFNGAFESSCEGSESEKDECAARIAWSQVRKKYRKMQNGKWVAKSNIEGYHDITMVITKASVQADGSVRWQAVTSDTDEDRSGESTSVELFQDWIERATYGIETPFLPEPGMPFLGVSHYPALEGFGEAGITRRMFIDGNKFKADGVFYADRPVGKAAYDAIRKEQAMIRKGETVEKPIRISAGWWDLVHFHKDSDFLFVRQSLSDKCPICAKGQTFDKEYRQGQLDHFACTRVPMNPRTSIGLQEKSNMNKVTRKDDAATILDDELAEELDQKAKLVGKSEAPGEDDELLGAMVVRATAIGDHLRKLRNDQEMTVEEVASKMPIEASTITSIESGEIETPSEPVIAAFAKVYGVSAKSIKDKLPGGAEPNKEVAKSEGETEPDDVSPDAAKNEMMEEEERHMPMMPFGGAVTIEDAEKFIETRQKMGELHSHWDIFQTVTRNIMAADDEAVPDKLDAMSQAVQDLGQRIDSLKAGLADAYLIQEADFDDEGDLADIAQQAVSDAIEGQPGQNINKSNVQRGETMTAQQNQANPVDAFKAAVDAALADGSLDRAGKEQAIQEALNNVAGGLQGQLNQSHPLPPAEQLAEVMQGAISKAMTEALAPLAQQVGLLAAKQGQVGAAQPQQAAQTVQMAMPQQKSYATGQPQPQPVAGDGNNGGNLPISPVTKQPSALTAAIRKSVGLQN